MPEQDHNLENSDNNSLPLEDRGLISVSISHSLRKTYFESIQIYSDIELEDRKAYWAEKKIENFTVGSASAALLMGELALIYNLAAPFNPDAEPEISDAALLAQYRNQVIDEQLAEEMLQIVIPDEVFQDSLKAIYNHAMNNGFDNGIVDLNAIVPHESMTITLDSAKVEESAANLFKEKKSIDNLIDVSAMFVGFAFAGIATYGLFNGWKAKRSIKDIDKTISNRRSEFSKGNNMNLPNLDT